MVADTYVPNLTVIDTTIEQLESEVSLITIYCLRLFVVFKYVMLQGQTFWWVTHVYQVLLSLALLLTS